MFRLVRLALIHFLVGNTALASFFDPNSCEHQLSAQRTYYEDEAKRKTELRDLSPEERRLHVERMLAKDVACEKEEELARNRLRLGAGRGNRLGTAYELYFLSNDPSLRMWELTTKALTSLWFCSLQHRFFLQEYANRSRPPHRPMESVDERVVIWGFVMGFDPRLLGLYERSAVMDLDVSRALLERALVLAEDKAVPIKFRWILLSHVNFHANYGLRVSSQFARAIREIEALREIQR